MRLTSLRCNGIKQGYWSAAKKEDLVQRLAAYENTGLEPEEIHPVRVGHWVEKYPLADQFYYYCECSLCGRIVKVQNTKKVCALFPFCNCGAKMEDL